MKKTMVMVAVLAMFACTGLFAQDKRPRNLKDSGFQIDQFIEYDICQIIAYSGPVKDPQSTTDGPIVDVSSAKTYNGKRYPLFIMFPNKFTDEPVMGTIRYIQTGPNQTVDILIKEPIKASNLWLNLFTYIKVYVIQPNSIVEFNLDRSKDKVPLVLYSGLNGGPGTDIAVRKEFEPSYFKDKLGFVLRKGSIKLDKDFKEAQDADNMFEFYSTAADTIMGAGTIKQIEALRYSLNIETKEGLADALITNFQVQNGAFSTLTGLAPLWLMPADFAVDWTKNLMKASLAYGIWYCYTGKKMSSDDLKDDLYILLDNDDVQGTLKKLAGMSASEAAGKGAGLAGELLTKEKLIEKIGKTAFRKAVKNNSKLAEKITAKSQSMAKANKAVPIAATVVGVATDLSDLGTFAANAKLYYGFLAQKNYTVTFDKNGGTSEAKPPKKIVSDPATTVGSLPAAPTRTGYTFEGWNTKADGSGKTFTEKTAVNADTTVYAKWKGINVTVTFDANGSDGKPNPPTKTVTVGENYGTMSTITRSGYSFGGWLPIKTPDGKTTPIGPSTTVKETKNHTLYAQWSTNALTIKFDTNGGEASIPDKGGSPPYTLVNLPSVPKQGFTFDGWYTAKTGGYKIDEPYVVTSSVTLYAHFTSANDAKEKEKYQKTIQDNCKFGTPKDVWKAIDTHGGFMDVYKIWAGTYPSNTSAQAKPKGKTDKQLIQDHCKFKNPDAVWLAVNKHKFSDAVFKAWADSYYKK